jgi:hypothetical protein
MGVYGYKWKKWVFMGDGRQRGMIRHLLFHTPSPHTSLTASYLQLAAHAHQQTFHSIALNCTGDAPTKKKHLVKLIASL